MPDRVDRGSLPSQLRMTDEFLGARLQSVVGALDDMSQVKAAPPFGGGTLTRAEFRAALVNDLGDPPMLQRLAFRSVFATPKERAALVREIQRAFEAGGTGDPEALAPPPAPEGMLGAPPDPLAPPAPTMDGLSSSSPPPAAPPAPLPGGAVGPPPPPAAPPPVGGPPAPFAAGAPVPPAVGLLGPAAPPAAPPAPMPAPVGGGGWRR